jgi:hypothetical protein
MSEIADSFEPLDLPDVADVPRSGVAHGDTFEPSPTWEAPDRAQSPNTDAQAEAPPQGTRPQGSSRPDRGVGDRMNAEPPANRLRRGKAGRWRPSLPISSPHGGAAKRGTAPANGCTRCPSATTGRRPGTPSLVADTMTPAPFWAELNATSPPSLVPVHMANESFCPELEATVLGDLSGGGSAGGR